ncbi:putative phosphatase regulatory subunit-domain-containing protein [Flagelloscypha sp. PMI_526]|nr:putative phosphatase regulatory subunit-domain-containing protein [Flagelloscypha sp. PMI_526]
MQTSSRTTNLLANGTPLKSSLKPASAVTTTTPRAHSPCSPSMSHPGMVSSHGKDIQELPRIITPSTPKNVHFADSLASIRVFHKFASPASISMSPASGYENHEEATESSSDERDSFNWGLRSTPWIHGRTIDSEPASFFQIDPLTSSPISLWPADWTTDRFIVLESLILVGRVNLSETRQTKSDNLRLAGTVLVRNVAFEKKVDIRFTLDNWDTLSEVEALWSNHLNVLPHSVTGTPGSIPPDYVGEQDIEGDERGWDRFSFTIRLCDYARSLPSRTLFLAARFQASSNQVWWDNNSGSNYAIRFREAKEKRTSRTVPTISPTTETSVERILATPGISREHPLSPDYIPASIFHSPSSPPLTIPSTPKLQPIIANVPVTYLDLDPVPPCPPNSPNSSTSPTLPALSDSEQLCKLSLSKFVTPSPSYGEDGSIDYLDTAVSGCPSKLADHEPKVEIFREKFVDDDISCSSSDDDFDELISCSSEDGNDNDDGTLLITPLEGNWRELGEGDVMNNTKLSEFVWPELPALEHFSTSSHIHQSSIDSSNLLYNIFVQHWCFAVSTSPYSV